MKPEPPIRRSLLIRADGSTQIGHGHVMRMLALTQAWRDQGGSVTLATRECPEFVLEQYRSEAAQIIRLPAQPMIEEARELKQLASDGALDAVVLDGYAFDSDYQSIVREGHYRVMVLDDDRHLERYSADVIVNQNIETKPSDYHARAPGIHVLAGLDYVLLRRQFRNVKLPGSCPAQSSMEPRARSPNEPTRILITLGGTDRQNLVAMVVDGLDSLAAEHALEVRLLMGSGNVGRTQLDAMAKPYRWLSILTDVVDMVPQYAWADLAVVGGGSTNWELCCFGLPRLVIVLADNQAANARGLERAGVAINLGDWRALSSRKIAQAISDLLSHPVALETQSQRARSLVDGQGAERVVDYLLELISTKPPQGKQTDDA